jgi:hypothetical protein
MPQEEAPSQAQAQPQPAAKPQMVDYKVAFPVD